MYGHRISTSLSAEGEGFYPGTSGAKQRRTGDPANQARSFSGESGRGGGAPSARRLSSAFSGKNRAWSSLSPYRLETLEEALPFYKELFAGEEDLGRRLLLAAVQESLPLTREVFFNLKKGLFTAEKEWGVKIHPRVVAFLQARALPLTPRTLLWALYVLFPSVQKVMWQRTGEQPPILPFLDKRPVDKGADAAGEKQHCGCDQR